MREYRCKRRGVRSGKMARYYNAAGRECRAIIRYVFDNGTVSLSDGTVISVYALKLR